jgi:hypothetical protein
MNERVREGAAASATLDPADLQRLINAASTGKRPYFFDDQDVDRLLSIVWAMAAELAVTRERLDTLERVLEGRGAVSQADIDAYRPDPQAAAARGQWQVEYIARLLRVLQQEAEVLRRASAGSERAAEDVARELARE